MQLDTTIEQRKREIGEISNSINNERERNERMANEVRDNQVDLLQKRLEKAKLAFT